MTPFGSSWTTVSAKPVTASVGAVVRLSTGNSSGGAAGRDLGDPGLRSPNRPCRRSAPLPVGRVDAMGSVTGGRYTGGPQMHPVFVAHENVSSSPYS